MILGEQTVTYFPPNDKPRSQPLSEPTVFSTWGRVSDTQYLLGDDYGRLYMLVLHTQQQKGAVSVTTVVNFVGKVRAKNPCPVKHWD